MEGKRMSDWEVLIEWVVENRIDLRPARGGMCLLSNTRVGVLEFPPRVDRVLVLGWLDRAPAEASADIIQCCIDVVSAAACNHSCLRGDDVFEALDCFSLFSTMYKAMPRDRFQPRIAKTR